MQEHIKTFGTQEAIHNVKTKCHSYCKRIYYQQQSVQYVKLISKYVAIAMLNKLNIVMLKCIYIYNFFFSQYFLSKFLLSNN